MRKPQEDLIYDNNRVNFFQLANFFRKQKLALDATKLYKYVLYAGSVGSGKSHWLRWTLLYWLLRWAAEGKRNVQVGLFCETYPALHDRHIKAVKLEFPSFLGDFYYQKHEFILKPEYGNGIIAFRNLDDPEKYRSAEFAIIAVDELTRNPKSTFDLLKTRLRWSGVKETKFIAATNPFGEHSKWVRELWVERNFGEGLKNESQEFFMVEAKSMDNPYLPQSYFKSLESLPDRERRAFLEGDWYALEETMDREGYIQLFLPRDIQNTTLKDDQGLWKFKPVVFGVDIGAGGDRTVIVVRNNFFAKVLFAEKLADTMSVISQIAKFFSFYQPDIIVIDTIGVGQGVYDRMIELGWGSRIRSVKFGGKPKDKQFENLKTELYWESKEWLKKGGKLVGAKEDWSELYNIKYKIKSDRTIALQGKDELRKIGIPSPDIADAFALTFLEDLSILNKIRELTEVNYQV